MFDERAAVRLLLDVRVGHWMCLGNTHRSVYVYESGGESELVVALFWNRYRKRERKVCSHLNRPDDDKNKLRRRGLDGCVMECIQTGCSDDRVSSVYIFIYTQMSVWPCHPRCVPWSRGCVCVCLESSKTVEDSRKLAVSSQFVVANCW